MIVRQYVDDRYILLAVVVCHIIEGPVRMTISGADEDEQVRLPVARQTPLWHIYKVGIAAPDAVAFTVPYRIYIVVQPAEGALPPLPSADGVMSIAK